MCRRRMAYFLVFFGLLVVEVLIALFLHDPIIRPYGGDVLVIPVLYCLVRTVVPDRWRFLPLFLFLFAAGVEILQAVDFVHWLGLADNRFWRILLGSTFDWRDLLCYAIGSALTLFDPFFKKAKTIS